MEAKYPNTKSFYINSDKWANFELRKKWKSNMRFMFLIGVVIGFILGFAVAIEFFVK